MADGLFSPASREAAPDWVTSRGAGLLLLARDGRVLSADHVACELLGYADVEATRQAQAEGRLLVPNWPQLLEAVRGAAGRTVLDRLPCELLRADGQILHASISAVRGEAGNLDAVLIACPELQALQLSLRAAEARYLDLLDHCHNGIFVTDGDRFLYVNQEFADMLSCSRAELLAGECTSYVHEDDLYIAAAVLDAILRGDVTRNEYTIRLWRRDRIGIRDVSIRASRVMFEGARRMLGTVYDITELRRGEAALRDYARRLRLLSQQVIDIQENERRHLARELHDEIGQRLTLVKLSLEALWHHGYDPQVVEDALAGVAGLMDEVRSLSLDLRPTMLDDLGLAATLRWYAARVAKVAGLQVLVEIQPDFPRLDPNAETLCFRIAQEAVTNVIRHAEAATLKVALSANENEVVLLVADDGKGFDPTAASESALQGGSAGLMGMKERAALGGAALQVKSSYGEGSQLRLSLPRESAGFTKDSA